MKVTWLTTWLVMVGFSVAPGLAGAESERTQKSAVDLSEGLVIDSENVGEYDAYTAPGVRWLVDNGVSLTVGRYQKVEMPPPFVAATKRYFSRVRLAEDATHLIDHVAGLPFPDVDPNHPQAGAMLMFNFNAAIARDDLHVKNIECHSGSIGDGGAPFKVEKTFLLNSMRRLQFTGRISVQPTPELPSNKDCVRYKETLGPMIEPFDLKGTSLFSRRYISPARSEDTWLYLPALRRVRRLKPAVRSDGLFDQDLDRDSLFGFAGDPGQTDWRLLGEKRILATFHGTKIPVRWRDAPGDYIHEGSWEPRKVWVLEGVSKYPDYAYSKRVIYLDKETWHIALTELYDREGELWKVRVASLFPAMHPVPGAKYGLQHPTLFQPSVSMVDLQRGHATFCALPSSRFAEEQGWYVNVGEATGTVECWFEPNVSISGIPASSVCSLIPSYPTPCREN